MSAQTIRLLLALKYNIEVFNYSDLLTLTKKAALQPNANLRIWPEKTQNPSLKRRKRISLTISAPLVKKIVFSFLIIFMQH